MAASAQRITYVSPAPARNVLAPEPIFSKNVHPVLAAEADGEGDFRSNGISFQDFSFMQVQQRKQCGIRRLPTPEWANDYAKLRRLIARSWERRAGFKYPQPGTEKERMDRAQALLLKARPDKIATLDRLCSEYIAQDTSAERRKQLQNVIRTLDHEICAIDCGPARLAGIVRLYYGTAFDSVGVGAEMGISPANVRQTLMRLHRDWARMQRGETIRERIPAPPRPPKKPRFCAFCGREIPASAKKHFTYCGGDCEKHHRDRERIRPIECAQPKPTFCGPDCKEAFAHPLVNTDGGFGVSPELARQSAIGKDYEAYLATCARVGTNPLPEDRWRLGLR